MRMKARTVVVRAVNEQLIRMGAASIGNTPGLVITVREGYRRLQYKGYRAACVLASVDE
jgi:hypothetical protein